jgi:hypothetical protein
VAILLAAVPAPLSAAKPPDLPAATDVWCEGAEYQLAFELPAGSLRVDIEINQPGQDASPPCLDAWCPNLVPLVIERLAHALAEVARQLENRSRQDVNIAVPIRTSSVTDVMREETGEESDTAEQARLLFEIAGHYARAGKLEQARARLREAHMVGPTSHYGQRAIQQLLEMEAADRGDEGSVPTSTVPQRSQRRMKPESQESQSEDAQALDIFRRMVETTQPLGPAMLPSY